jgi:hypothetical protein
MAAFPNEFIMSPARSKSQQHLMAAAAAGADFPMAQKVRASMTMGQLHDFAATSTKNKPAHVNGSKKGGSHPHRNLGKYLHPKGGK